MQYSRGDFQYFRATDRISMGAVEGAYIEKDQVIEYDGSVVKIAGSEHTIPAMRSAIKEGWFVPEADTTSTRQIKAAGVAVRPAQHAGRDRDKVEINMTTIEDEERAVSTVGDAKLGYRHGQPTVTRGESGDEGVPVSRIKTAARQATKVTDAHAAQQAIQKLDSAPQPKAEAIATGDVQETIVGEHLEELLPDAASAEKPAPGIAGEGVDAAARAAAAKAARLAQVNKDEAARGAAPAPAPEVAPAAPSELDGKLAIIRMSIPDFEWDLSAQWRSRAKQAVEKYGDNPLYLNSIMAIETDAVKKQILGKLNK
ncbi:hypothetical protein N9917_03145 [Deltaproteobacteria bacterium]|nr:hypothetical protein [Deltaproteobacteria bacterium]